MRRACVHLAALAALGLLAGCGDDHYCWNCGPSIAPEVSWGLVAGNFNGNGHTSIVATSTVEYDPYFNPGNLKIYPSTGSGSFGAPLIVADGHDPLYLASGVLTSSGLPDVVSASYSDGQLAVFLNSASTPGTFAAPILLNSPGASQVAIADMNGDGLPDLVSADFGVSLFLQTSPGVFANPIGLYNGGANWVALGDLNGDGIPDIALTDAVGVKVLFHAGAAGTVAYSAPVTLFNQTPNADFQGANLIAIADVNGDGLNDLVITDPGSTGCGSPTVAVLLQDAAAPGQFLAPQSYAAPDSCGAQSIVVTDLDGDGHPDIIIGGTSGVTVLLQDGSTPGTFLAATHYAAPRAHEIAVADVDGDGRPDIIVATGVPSPAPLNGVEPNAPGVLLQSATSPGTFGTLQALP